MASIFTSAVANHNDSCQRAVRQQCDCKCNGIIHQRNIIIAALESKGTPRQFDDELTRLFGSSFSMISSDPLPSEKSRREWRPMAKLGKGARESQTEQRIVDVALRDILLKTHGIPVGTKLGWVDFYEQLTLQRSWRGLAQDLRTLTGAPNRQSGYYWAAVLASLAAVASSRTAPTGQAVGTFLQTSSSVFQETRHPRANSGNKVKLIKEVANSGAFARGTESATAAWNANNLSFSEKRLVLSLVGATVSPDLWKQPVAVRYLLIPAVTYLRQITNPSLFSLDNPGRLTESILAVELGQKWQQAGAW